MYQATQELRMIEIEADDAYEFGRPDLGERVKKKRTSDNEQWQRDQRIQPRRRLRFW